MAEVLLKNSVEIEYLEIRGANMYKNTGVILFSSWKCGEKQS